jgi:hypothetical protein
LHVCGVTKLPDIGYERVFGGGLWLIGDVVEFRFNV